MRFHLVGWVSTIIAYYTKDSNVKLKKNIFFAPKYQFFAFFVFKNNCAYLKLKHQIFLI